VRLRARIVGECFAVLGIAAGVALLFASQVASQSLESSVADLSRGIVGKASLQVLARDPHGMDASLVARVRGLAGVRAAAPLLEEPARVAGPRGSDSVLLIGADSSLAALGGSLVTRIQLAPFAGIGAILLPRGVADRIGVRRFGAEAALQVAGRRASAPLYAVLGGRQIGALAASPVVVAPLFYAQELAGVSSRVSRILVEAAAGRGGQVAAELRAIAAGRLDVRGTGYDQELFVKAAAASNQSTALFAVISALVGFLFAFNAMLLSVPLRRRLIVDLRRDGYTPSNVVAVLLLDGVMLGLVACALGLLLGEELSVHLFRANPGYLGSAFAVGEQRVVGWSSFVVAVGGGMFAACAAVLSPLRDVVSRDPLAAVMPRKGRPGGGRPGRFGHVWRLGRDGRSRVWGAFAGVVCVAAATLVLVFWQREAIVGMMLLTAALLLALPVGLDLALGALRMVARRVTGATGHVAGMELAAARSRAVGVAATGAIAVFGAVSIQGAHADLLGGLEHASRDMNAFTDIWVAPTGSYNLLRTAPFGSDASQQTALRRVPGVRDVRVYRGGLLDWGSRRVWVIAPPDDARPLLPASQIVEGDATMAEQRVRSGGWVVLSRALADEHAVRIGQLVRIPTAAPVALRVAALSTNIGWAPGAMIMNSSYYARASGSRDASAYNIIVAPGANVGSVVAGLRRRLGPATGLTVQSAAAHAAEQNALSRQGLARLSQIAALILIVAVLAMAAAIANMVWQRRPRLAKLKLEGFPRKQLWRTILLESSLLLAVGCLCGAVFGLYGQQLLDRALANVINFPVVHSVALAGGLLSVALVSASALMIVAIPGYLATGVAPAVALED
jgi:putative ABC transport system permease protein